MNNVISVMFIICVMMFSQSAFSDNETHSLGDRLIMGIWLQENMPLTYNDAISNGWQDMSSECEYLFGYRLRYIDNETGLQRLTPTLMFGESGNLYGFQVVTNTTIFPFYPDSNMHIPYTMDLSFLDSETAGFSFYFQDPEMICNSTETLSASTSIGDRLWLRQGIMSNAEIDFDVIPLFEKEIIGGSPSNAWTAGGCAPSGFAFPNSPGMGTHYWRYLKQSTLCINSGPIFLLYANDSIVAMGMTLVGTNGIVPTDGGIRPTLVNGRLVMPPPSLWEFARQPLYPYFFTSPEQDPQCLENLNSWNSSLPYGMITTGTMHIFFKDPFDISCPIKNLN